MSFGRASSAVGDSNEDGTSAEANLVNQASENGLVCVAAIERWSKQRKLCWRC